MYKFLCGCTFSFLWDIYLGVDLLGHIVTLGLTFWEITKLFFQSSCSILHPHQQCMRVPVSLQPTQHLLSVVLIIAILVRVKWRYLSYRLVVNFFDIFWILDSLQICDLQNFTPTLWVVLFTFLIVFFEAQTFLTLIKFNLFFSFVAYVFGVKFKKQLPSTRQDCLIHEDLQLYFILQILWYQILPLSLWSTFFQVINWSC